MMRKILLSRWIMVNWSLHAKGVIQEITHILDIFVLHVVLLLDPPSLSMFYVSIVMYNFNTQKLVQKKTNILRMQVPEIVLSIYIISIMKLYAEIHSFIIIWSNRRTPCKFHSIQFPSIYFFLYNYISSYLIAKIRLQLYTKKKW